MTRPDNKPVHYGEDAREDAPVDASKLPTKRVSGEPTDTEHGPGEVTDPVGPRSSVRVPEQDEGPTE